MTTTNESKSSDNSDNANNNDNDNDNDNSHWINKPMPISWFLSPMINVIQIDCGIWHSCVLTNNGSIYVFGLNRDGQLGLGKDVKRTNEPQLVTFYNNSDDDNDNDNDNVEQNEIDIECNQISCGARHCSVLDKDGTVWIWGNNKFNHDHVSIVWLPKQISKSIVCQFDQISNIKCGQWCTIMQ